MTLPLDLVQAALQARAFSYCPYSDFAVGAALLCTDGRIYTGCNIENAAFGPTVCAERTAIFKAISEGARSFAALAVVGGPAKETIQKECPPCGVCRQVLREFCDDEFPIYLSADGKTFREISLQSLLPESFQAGQQFSKKVF